MDDIVKGVWDFRWKKEEDVESGDEDKAEEESKYMRDCNEYY